MARLNVLTPEEKIEHLLEARRRSARKERRKRAKQTIIDKFEKLDNDIQKEIMNYFSSRNK